MVFTPIPYSHTKSTKHAFFLRINLHILRICCIFAANLTKSQGIVFPALQNNIMNNLRKQTWGETLKFENTRLDTGNG